MTKYLSRARTAWPKKTLVPSAAQEAEAISFWPAFVTGLVVSADTLQVWFPAHRALAVLQQLQQKKDSYRAGNFAAFLHWDMVPLQGYSGRKVLLPGALLGLKVATRSFSPMICHWMIGMQGSTPCQRCGQRLPCWELTIYAKLLAMTFISWGEVWCPESTLETKGPGWYSATKRAERLFTNKLNQPGDDIEEPLRTDGNTAAWQAWSTTQNQLRHANSWYFRANKRFFVPCVPKSEKKNK